MKTFKQFFQRKPKPKLQWTNHNGTVVRVYPTNEPHKFTITKDHKPLDPWTYVDKATK